MSKVLAYETARSMRLQADAAQDLAKRLRELADQLAPRVRVWRDDDYTTRDLRDGARDISTFAGWHHRYNIGDVQPKESPAEWLAENAPEGSAVLVVSMTDHGGLSFYEGEPRDPWDSGFVGYLVMTPEQMKDAGVETMEGALSILRGMLASYDEVHRGDVWGFTVDDDSCGGFIGTSALDDMLGEVAEADRDALRKAWEACS